MRNPLTNPKAGDIVQYRQYIGFPQPSPITVMLILPPLIAFVHEGDIEWETLEFWISEAGQKETIHAAE